jgi:DNA polymerase III delta prime subunit
MSGRKKSKPENYKFTFKAGVSFTDVVENCDDSDDYRTPSVWKKEDKFIRENQNILLKIKSVVTPKVKNDGLPWVEKYRPKRLDDLLLEPMNKEKIKSWLTSDDFRSVILTGNSGIGKTSTALVFAREYFKKHGVLMSDAFMELNASDIRGLQMITSNIEPFCKKKLSNDVNKIILLDEADNITEKAQPYLTQIIDNYPKTILIFTCNNFTQIIPSIQSRCQIIRFNAINDDMVADKLMEIAQKENIKYDIEAIYKIVEYSNGDFRQALNILQLISIGYNEITEANIDLVYQKPKSEKMHAMMNALENMEFGALIETYQQLQNEGYFLSDILLSMVDAVKATDYENITRCQYEIIKEIYNAYITTNQGFEEPIIMYGLLGRLFKLIKSG